MPLHSLISSLGSRRHTRASSSPSHSTPDNDAKGLKPRLWDIFVRMWDLGFTAFGGPPVHFQILHRRFVEGKGNWGEGGGGGRGEEDGEVVEASRKWIDEQTVSFFFSIFQFPFFAFVFGIRVWDGKTIQRPIGLRKERQETRRRRVVCKQVISTFFCRQRRGRRRNPDMGITHVFQQQLILNDQPRSTKNSSPFARPCPVPPRQKCASASPSYTPAWYPQSLHSHSGHSLAQSQCSVSRSGCTTSLSVSPPSCTLSYPASMRVQWVLWRWQRCSWRKRPSRIKSQEC